MSLLITGCPRSGTLYTSEFIRRHGIKCVHEMPFTTAPVLVDWHGVVRCYPRRRIHLFRDPIRVISSLLTIHKPSRLFIAHHVPECGNIFCADEGEEIRFMSMFWLRWTQQSLRLADRWVRVEDIHKPEGKAVLQEFIPEMQTEFKPRLERTLNTRPHRELRWGEVQKVLDRDVYSELRNLVWEYGYG